MVWLHYILYFLVFSVFVCVGFNRVKQIPFSCAIRFFYFVRYFKFVFFEFENKQNNHWWKLRAYTFHASAQCKRCTDALFAPTPRFQSVSLVMFDTFSSKRSLYFDTNTDWFDFFFSFFFRTTNNTVTYNILHFTLNQTWKRVFSTKKSAIFLYFLLQKRV